MKNCRRKQCARAPDAQHKPDVILQVPDESHVANVVLSNVGQVVCQENFHPV